MSDHELLLEAVAILKTVRFGLYIVLWTVGVLFGSWLYKLFHK